MHKLRKIGNTSALKHINKYELRKIMGQYTPRRCVGVDSRFPTSSFPLRPSDYEGRVGLRGMSRGNDSSIAELPHRE